MGGEGRRKRVTTCVCSVNQEGREHKRYMTLVKSFAPPTQPLVSSTIYEKRVGAAGLLSEALSVSLEKGHKLGTWGDRRNKEKARL